MVTHTLENEKKLSICFYRYSLFNRGGDRMVIEYANHLASRGHDVAFMARKIDTIFSIHRNVKMLTVSFPGKPGFVVYGTVKKLPYDIILVDIIHLPLALSLRNRVLYFAQADDVEYYGSFVARKAMDLLYKAYLSRNMPIITVSEHLADAFSRRYGFHNSHIVPNGIDFTVFYPEPDVRLLDRKGKRKAVVFMARGDHYRKGYDLALHVLHALDVEASGKMELWVCGNAIDQAGFDFPVRNFGTVADSRLRQILSSADIFFYPSRHEGFGLFPLEAMACGTVVVTTEAIPYARSTSAMLTSPVGNIADLTKNVKRIILDDSRLNNLKNKGIMEARPHDLKLSKIAFETTLTNIMIGKTV